MRGECPTVEAALGGPSGYAIANTTKSLRVKTTLWPASQSADAFWPAVAERPCPTAAQVYRLSSSCNTKNTAKTAR